MGTIALCSRCRRETLPQLKQPSWHREKHRASAAERETPESPEARKIRERKEQKRDTSLRKQIRAEGMIATVKTFLLRRAEKQALRSEDCEECRQLQHESGYAA